MGRPRKNRIDETKEEFCNCGHMKILHVDRYQKNHGWCIVNRCICSQFTWIGIGVKNLIGRLDPIKTMEYTREDWAAIDKAVKEVNGSVH